ncbi:aminotransferase DegT [Candidatus Magnetomorum sp. HK-1]|nr:aminotransferase DegT [Candidatus Magnetomorum sp. HK-1]
METLAQNITKTLMNTLPKEKKIFPLHEPYFSGNEWKYVKDCIDSGWVSSTGKFVNMFEEQLAQYTGSKYAIAVVNGTAALHMCLKLAGIKNDDEVIIPALSFVATANAVSYCGAIPHFVDSEKKTLGIDPVKLEDYLKDIAQINSKRCINKKTGRRIRAVVPVHTYGHPADLDAIKIICERYSLVLIEDAAESLGSFYKGYHTGTYGLLSAVSFNGNKTITTGGGGAILTNNKILAEQAKHLTTTAKKTHKWEYFHDAIGYNYRMPNINAAIGCAQLEQLPEMLEKKRELAIKYESAFQTLEGVTFFTEPENSKSNYWLNCIFLKEPSAEKKKILLETLNTSGIMARPAWNLLHLLPMYKNCPGMPLSFDEKISISLINIPSSVNANER